MAIPLGEQTTNALLWGLEHERGEKANEWRGGGGRANGDEGKKNGVGGVSIENPCAGTILEKIY